MSMDQLRNRGVSPLLLLVTCAALIWLYLPFLGSLIYSWDTDDNYSHGYFIPVVCLYMIYSMHVELRRSIKKPAFSGLVLIAVGLLLLLLGKVGSEYFVQRFSLIVVIAGIVLFYYGWKVFVLLLLPIAYLIFMIPLPAIVWNKIAFPLQLFSSLLTEKIIYFVGIPVFREGNVLHLPNTSLEVVAACSGLRSLVTMFALSSALAFLTPISGTKKTILFLSAAPIAVFANIVRLTATAFLASIYGPDVAQGFLHDMSGMVVFLLGLSMLIGASRLLAK